jgi:hypothetical protein
MAAFSFSKDLIFGNSFHEVFGLGIVHTYTWLFDLIFVSFSFEGWSIFRF